MMRVIPGVDAMTLAVINPSIKMGKPGQYLKYEAPIAALRQIGAEAMANGMELRWYYKSLETAGGEPVASQVIITDIPSGYIQPFHTHHRIHEITIVESGEIGAIDSEVLTPEDDIEELAKRGRILSAGQMVIEGPGTRHTIFNPSRGYARLYTVQTARIPLNEFPHDWHGDKPI